METMLFFSIVSSSPAATVAIDLSASVIKLAKCRHSYDGATAVMVAQASHSSLHGASERLMLGSGSFMCPPSVVTALVTACAWADLLCHLVCLLALAFGSPALLAA